MSTLAFLEERCILHGQIIPEGRQVYVDCECRVRQGYMSQGKQLETLASPGKEVSMRQRILSLIGEMNK